MAALLIRQPARFYAVLRPLSLHRSFCAIPSPKMASKYLVKKDAVVLTTQINDKAVQPDNVDIVIYHADCTDGFAAAFAAWLRLRDTAQYIPLQHGPGLVAPDVTGKRVAIVDFSFNEAITRNLIAQAAGLVVLDHHASAQSVLAGIPDANKVFEMKQSGATLSWDFFQAGTETPLLFRYIEDRDIWRWAYADSEAFSAGLGLVEKSFESWETLLNSGEAGLASIIDRGKAILSYQQKVRDGHVKRARAVRLKAAPQYVGLVVNGSTIASDIGNAMCQVEIAVPCTTTDAGAESAAAAPALPARAQFGMIWEYEHEKKVFRVSLRSDSDDVDVSAIARSFGGGGHKRAAGFTHTGSSIEELLMDVEGLPTDWKPIPATEREKQAAKAAAAARGATATTEASASGEPNKKARLQ